MKHLEKIIDELCQMDPTLEKKRPELKKMIAKIIEAQPDTKFDESFKKTLYRQLMAKASATEHSPASPSFFSSLFMKPLPSLLGGLVMGAVLMFATVQYLPLSPPTPPSQELAESDSFEQIASYGPNDVIINGRGPGAFGPLSMSVRSQSGGGGGMANPASIADSKMLIAPDMPYRPTHYEYNYTGELNLPVEPLEVLKRVRGKELLQDLPNGVRQLAAGLIDLSAFDNIKLNSLDMLQTNADGFSININFSEGTVNIFKQYDYRPYVESQQPPKISLPTDESLFSMANTFLSRYNISLESYGSPEINKYWEQFPGNELPQQITVVYPLMINGKAVYDQGGTKYGINLNIDLVENEVVSVWNIRSNQFESSSYPAIADQEKVLDIAKKGGLFPDYYFSEEEKATIALELSTPEEAYLNFYSFNEQTGQSEEVLVPSLIFSVTSEHKDDQFPPRQKIVVPLSKEIIEEMEQQAPMPVDVLR
ncbi:MAG: hypothetical protein AB7J40_06390 [Candidatus Altimarinota bacterium]